MEVENFTVDLIQKAREDRNENPETRDQIIEELRRMIEDQQKFTSRMDDAFLLCFLRVNKFNCLASFQLIQNYYQHRRDYPNLYKNFRPSALRNFFEDESQPMILPDRDQFGRSVFVSQIGKWNTSKCSAFDYCKGVILILERLSDDIFAQVCGHVVIIDLKGFGFYHARNFTPFNIQRLLSYVLEASPVEMKELHVIRQPPIFSAVYSLVKPLLSEGVRSRIFFHGNDIDSLHKFVSPNMLPKELGGCKPSLDNSDFYNTLLSDDNNFSSSTESDNE